jgi:hypothetical protein
MVCRRDVACFVSLATSPTGGEQPVCRLEPALLVLVVSARRTVANLFAILSRDPAVERAFERIRLGSHQSGRPQQRISPTGPYCIAEELLAGACQNDGFTMICISLLRKVRELKVHEPIVAYISQKSCTAVGGQMQERPRGVHGRSHGIRASSRGRVKEIDDRCLISIPR